MRPLLHLLSVVLVLPGVALAGAFLLLGHAIATHSVFGFLGELLSVFLWLIPWGLLAVLVALLALVSGGFSARLRWVAASCVVVLAIGSSIAVLVAVAAHGNLSAGQLGFFVPAVVSASVGLWIAVVECPFLGRAGGAAPPELARTVE